MMYDLVIGFLVPGEKGSSGRGIGSSIGKGEHVWKYFLSAGMYLRYRKMTFSPLFYRFCLESCV